MNSTQLHGRVYSIPLKLASTTIIQREKAWSSVSFQVFILIQSPIPNPQSPIPNPQSPIPNPQSRPIQSTLINFKQGSSLHHLQLQPETTNSRPNPSSLSSLLSLSSTATTNSTNINAINNNSNNNSNNANTSAPYLLIDESLNDTRVAQVWRSGQCPRNFFEKSTGKRFQCTGVSHSGELHHVHSSMDPLIF